MPDLATLDRPARGPHRVARIMGTAVGIDVRDPGVPVRAVDDVIVALRAVEARFSPYLPESEVSRFIDGDLDGADLSQDLLDVLGMSEGLRRVTDGYFDIRGHRPDGRPDPTGLVKGWAVERASRLLDAVGADNYAINAGGDVIVRGEPEPGRPWRVGLRHPRLAGEVSAVLRVRDMAVATSGAYERGEHIVDPHTGRASSGLLSLTVVGPSLTYADAFATAAFAMGTDGIAWVASQAGYGAYGVTSDDRAVWTPGIDRLLV